MKAIQPIFLLLVSLLFAGLVQAAGVERGQFTTAVVDREPVDEVIEVGPEQDRITYFTELRDLTGHQITHQWMYDDSVMFEKTFSIGGPRWRVWSSKNLRPEWTGTWVVNTLDDDGTLLMSQSFNRK